jgi:hypothetical protein
MSIFVTTAINLSEDALEKKMMIKSFLQVMRWE